MLEMAKEAEMKKQTIVELDLDVAGFIIERDRIMHEIEVGIIALFMEHKRTTDQNRSTGCFHVELSLPEIEREVTPYAGGKQVTDLNIHPTGPECTESCLHGFGCGTEYKP